MKIIEELFTLFRKRGDSSYFGEPVTQTEHALQTAASAAGQGAPPALKHPSQDTGFHRSP
jgi:predicted HD phosphohydrolase